MKNRIIHILIIAIVIGMGVVVKGMYTNSRYYLDVTADTHPHFANTVFRLTPEGQDTFDIIPGQSRVIRYDLHNTDVGGNINENNLIYYVKLVDGAGNEVSSPISFSVDGYSYVAGKGYGPISLAYDGTTSDIKVLDINVSCNSSYRVKDTLNYKIRTYAESINDSSVHTTKDAAINFNILCYNIQYFVDGVENTTLTPAVYSPNETVTLPIPEQDGKVFKGWYLNPEYGGSAYTSFSNQYGDKVYYGKFEDRPMMLTYVIYDSVTEIHEYAYGDNVSLLVPNEREGFEFQGWYTDTTWAEKVESIPSITSDRTLYGKWGAESGTFAIGTLLKLEAPVASNSSTGEWANPGVTGYDAATQKYYLQDYEYIGYYGPDPIYPNVHSNKTTFSRDSMDWYVWDKDTVNHTITLISSKPTSQNYSIWGQVGFSNAVFFMDDICNMFYGGGGELDGIYARNIRASDLEKKIMKYKNMAITDENVLELRKSYNSNYLKTAVNVTSNYRYAPYCFGDTTDPIDFFSDVSIRHLEDDWFTAPSKENARLRSTYTFGVMHYMINNFTTETDVTTIDMIHGTETTEDFWFATRSMNINGAGNLISYGYKKYSVNKITQAYVVKSSQEQASTEISVSNARLRPMLVIDTNKWEIQDNGDGTVSLVPKS